MHARPFGPDRSFLTLVPDYLAGVKIESSDNFVLLVSLDVMFFFLNRNILLRELFRWKLKCGLFMIGFCEKEAGSFF